MNQLERIYNKYKWELEEANKTTQEVYDAHNEALMKALKELDGLRACNKFYTK